MFQLTIIIILTVFISDIILSTLNYRYRNQPIPENVADVYNEEGYRKWLNYTMEIFRLSIFVKILNRTVLILFLTLDLFPAIAKVASSFSTDPVIQTILFLGIYSCITYVLSIGFRLYRTFNIEERYGFNKSTIKIFLLDQLKSIMLTVTLGGAILYILLHLYQLKGSRALVYAWLFVIPLILTINILYTKIFVRIFNKLTPLPEGELYEKVKALIKSTGYKLGKISVMDASKRSSRLNAFFSGFGNFKHIILYDTLLEKCSTDEIISVLAHEIGHAKQKDALRNFFISMVQLGVYLAFLKFFLTSKPLAAAFGFPEVHIGFALIIFGILMEPFGILLGIPLTALSRKAEYKADAFAAKSGYRHAMISALKVLARENFSNLTPHPLVVKLTYSHPPVSQRINALSKSDKEEKTNSEK